MKDIMARESSGAGEGVPRFEYNPPTAVTAYSSITLVAR